MIDDIFWANEIQPLRSVIGKVDICSMQYAAYEQFYEITKSLKSQQIWVTSFKCVESYGRVGLHDKVAMTTKVFVI